jgi:hypothetical protein
LERYDGYFDLLELKSPQDPLIVDKRKPDDSPGSPSQLALSESLAQAFAQAHAYREILTAHAKLLQDQYGLFDTRFPRLIIIAGRRDTLDTASQHVLRQLNLSMHRVKIVPFDVLARRAELLLDNVVAHLEAEGPQVKTDDFGDEDQQLEPENSPESENT